MEEELSTIIVYGSVFCLSRLHVVETPHLHGIFEEIAPAADMDTITEVNIDCFIKSLVLISYKHYELSVIRKSVGSVVLTAQISDSSARITTYCTIFPVKLDEI